MNKFSKGAKILEGIDFTKLDDCFVEEQDGIFYLIVKYSGGETTYILGIKTKN